MIKHKDHFHGSDLEAIEKCYHIKKEDIISFSANVNPLGISYQLRSTLADNLDAITTYPDREYTVLRTCIATYAGTQPENVIVGNGSTELISLFIQTKHPKKALVLGPTYSEYEREIALGGGTTLYYPLKEEHGFHMDVEKDVTSIPLTNYYTNLIILRGTSKFFAAPGLRLGYAVTGNQDLIKAINTRKNPWTINSLAEIAGRLMFPDEEYIRHTRELICRERDRLYNELSTWDSVTVYEASANFILMKIRKPGITSQDLFDHCIRKGLMIRDCSTFPFLDDHFVRFCMMLPEQNDRLLEAFREVLL